MLLLLIYSTGIWVTGNYKEIKPNLQTLVVGVKINKRAFMYLFDVANTASNSYKKGCLRREAMFVTCIFPVWDKGISSHCVIIIKECLKHTGWLNSCVLHKLLGNSGINFEIERFTRRNCSWRKGLEVNYYFPLITLLNTYLTWKLHGPILRMWVNCLKAAKAIRGNCTLNY